MQRRKFFSLFGGAAFSGFDIRTSGKVPPKDMDRITISLDVDWNDLKPEMQAKIMDMMKEETK